MNNGDEMALKAAEFSAAAFMRRFLSDTSKSIAGASKLTVNGSTENKKPKT
jgi:hypothetical protein